MALKIHPFVEHGYIDNRKPGLISGRLWLHGRETPLELTFEGDCLRDMAGCLTTFRNRCVSATTPRWLGELAVEQYGTAGTMTASLRIARQMERENPVWENALSLEWFSAELGRVVLESADYDVEISAHEWQMDSEQEQALLMCNQSAMRDYAESVLAAAFKKTAGNSMELAPVPFLSAGRRVRGGEIVSELYREVCDKYGFDHDAEVSRAFVMGWDHVLSAMAHTEETGEAFFFSEPEANDMSPELEELTEEEEMRICRGNPLYERIQQFAIISHEWVKHFSVEIVDTGCPQYRLLQGVYSIIEKIALVFVRISRGESGVDRLVQPLTCSLNAAENVRKILLSMTLPGQEPFHEELLSEWGGIGKELAKFRFKMEHRG